MAIVLPYAYGIAIRPFRHTQWRNWHPLSDDFCHLLTVG